MPASILLKYFAGLALFSIPVLGGLYLLRERLEFWGRTVVFLLFYISVRYSLRLAPSGLVPYVAATPLFYSILAVFCLTGGWFYITKIEGMKLSELGWTSGQPGAGYLWGAIVLIIGAVPLLALNLPLKTDSLRLSPGMIGVAASFGVVLGGFFEETIFRGVIQMRLIERMSKPKAILLQAVIFSAGHLFYFPFDKHAFFYYGTFMIGLAAGILRDRVSMLAAGIFHGGLVILTVLAPDWMFGFLFGQILHTTGLPIRLQI